MSMGLNAGRGRGSTDHGKTWLGLRPATLIMLVAIAVLLVPLSMLSQPADSASPGGTLARLRTQYGL